jgi:succinate-semialdehyde dehydrogenase/glutarate-semialdehyde dehydrogenase
MPYQTINPSNEQRIRVFPEHTDEQLEELISRAQSTYQNDWSQRTLAERKTILKNAASILRQRRSDFARLLTLEMGKLLRDAGGRWILAPIFWTTMPTMPRSSSQQNSSRWMRVKQL